MPWRVTASAQVTEDIEAQIAARSVRGCDTSTSSAAGRVALTRETGCSAMPGLPSQHLSDINAHDLLISNRDTMRKCR